MVQFVFKKFYLGMCNSVGSKILLIRENLLFHIFMSLQLPNSAHIGSKRSKFKQYIIIQLPIVFDLFKCQLQIVEVFM